MGMALKEKIIEDLSALAVDISLLVPDPANARTHNTKNIEAIKASMTKFGQRQPIVIQKDGMIVRAGNGRLQAAKELGWRKIAALVIDDDNITATAYAIADNRSGELAEWDEDALEKILRELDDDLQIGWNKDDLNDLFNDAPKDGLIQDDEIPEVKESVTKIGDLWLLGEHRLLCGDSTSADDVVRLMDGQKADLCLTDPPYGIAGSTSDKGNYNTIDDTKDSLSKIIAGFLPLAMKHAKFIALTPGKSNIFDYPRPDWCFAWGYAGSGMSAYGFNMWQPLIVYGKDPKLAAGEGAHPDAIFKNMDGESAEQIKNLSHPCPKSMAVWREWMQRFSNKKTKLVYDPFLGSGTTLIACEQLNRKCYGMEIGPHYCDVIVKRWEEFSGKKAQLDG